MKSKRFIIVFKMKFGLVKRIGFSLPAFIYFDKLNPFQDRSMKKK